MAFIPLILGRALAKPISVNLRALYIVGGVSNPDSRGERHKIGVRNPSNKSFIILSLHL